MIKLNAFKITNFRSIVDSNWVSASPDAITVLVGQNESGKTSVLQALNYALNRGSITSDDKRIGADDPVVYLKITTTIDEIEIEDLQAFSKDHQTFFEKYLTGKVIPPKIHRL